MPDLLTYKRVSVLDEPLKVRYKGLFDFEGLYRLMYAWYKSQRYEMQEDLYKDKIDTPLGNEIEIKWSGWKRVDEIAKYWVKVYIHIWEGKEIEVVDGTLRRKLFRARMNIEFSGEIDFDYQKLFKRSKVFRPILSKMREREFLIKYVDDLTYSVIRYQTQVKKFLHMEGQENAYG